MPSVSLNAISKPENITTDNTNPLSFLEWRKRHIGISMEDADAQYKKYLTTLYKTTEEKNSLNKIREDYINLIKRLSIVFSNDPAFERFKNIDLSNEIELKHAIPLYAKKLKELALFYSKKRQELKNKKVEYNLVGSTEGIEKIVKNKLLYNFTKSAHTGFVGDISSVINTPELSSINPYFTIEMEELYDTTDYFNTSENITPLECILNNLCSNYSVSSLVDFYENEYICTPDNSTVSDIIPQLYTKYSGTDVYVLSGGYYTEKWDSITLDITQGDNFFYWFSGKTIFDIPDKVYENVAINDIDWQDATGNTELSSSDLLLVSVGNTVQGAWRYDTDIVTVKDTMSASITNGKIFKFPFPDFGTSSVGGEWSGPSINDTIPKSKSFFPNEESFSKNLKLVEDIYWTNFNTISTVHSINLQDSTLGKTTGFYSNVYDKADKIFISNDTNDKRIYSGTFDIGWLYRPVQTQLPIKTGTNNIYFPLKRYEDSSEVFFTFNQGSSITLSSIEVSEAFAGAVAGDSISSSDMIIKKTGICGDENEAAWLRSTPLKYFNILDKGQCSCDDNLQNLTTSWVYSSGGAQPALSFKCGDGQYVRFVWTGDTININNVQGFTGFDHDDSCPYKHIDHSTSLVDKNPLDDFNINLFEKWKKCTCQAVHYSPFGHNHSNLNQFNIIPDLIVKDYSFPDKFNTIDWRDDIGNNINTSDSAGRFYPELIEKDIGWGNGYWKSTNNTDFMLEKGQSYIYYRAKTNSCSFESPFFLINHSYKNTFIKNNECVNENSLPVWIKAIKNSDGIWVDTDQPSDMVLNFGDFIVYDHKENIQASRKRLLINDSEVLTSQYVTINPTSSAISYKISNYNIPSVDFLIKIPITSYNSYWGTRHDNSSRIVFDYLHVTQPEPLNIVLSPSTVIEYKFGRCDSTDFIWEQPLTFDVYSPISQWNKLDVDNCVNSNILDYLNKESNNCNIPYERCAGDCVDTICGCERECSISKIKNIKTFEKSDIIFNTELSGLPVFINYVARNSFEQSFKVKDITNGLSGLYVPIVSSSFITANAPWQNINNTNHTNIAFKELYDNLSTKDELSFYTIDKIAMNRYESYDDKVNISSDGSTYFINGDNYFDHPISQKYNKSEYYTYSDGSIKHNRQSFFPYTSRSEIDNKPIYGLYDGNTIKSDHTLSGSVGQWKTDIFGNQYFLVFDSVNSIKDPLSEFADGYFKKYDGKLSSIQDGLSSVFNKYKNISFIIEPSDINEYLSDESGRWLSLEDGINIIL